MTHSEIVMAAYKWVIQRGSCGVAFREFKTYASNCEYPDVIGFGTSGSTLIECKISRNDFKRDAKKLFRMNPELGMGKFRYYCVPKGLIFIEELPEKWGLLEVYEDGKARRTHNPYGWKAGGNIYQDGFSPNIKAENELMYSALRRLHIKGHIECVYDQRYGVRDEMLLPPMPADDNSGPF